MARMLGHATPATTMRVYASFLGDGQRRAARALGSALLPAENDDISEVRSK